MGGTSKRRRPAVAGLPASVRAAWGLREAPAKGPKPALTLSRIVQAGVDVAAAEGLDAVAMARVARALGVGTMTLYRYVAGKDDLLLLMVDAAYVSVPEPAGAGESWRDAMTRWARAHLEVLRRHPWLVRAPIAGAPVAPNQVRWFDRGLGALARTGLPEGQKLRVLLLVNGFVRNEALLAVDLAAAERAEPGGATRARSAYGAVLRELTAGQPFPALDALLASGVFDGPDEPDDDFEFGLERLLDGVAVLIRRQVRR